MNLDPRPDLSIVMPCLNEEDSVAECVAEALEGIKRCNLVGEVLIIDNGSTDKSREIAEKAGARVIREDVRGYGAACVRGLNEARGEWVIMGDADGTYDFAEFAVLSQGLKDEADFVMGNRLTSSMEAGAMPLLHRYVGTPLITRLLGIFSGVHVKDSQCGLRAIRRDVLPGLGLRATGMEFASEMLLKAGQADLRIAEVPITYRRRTGDSKLNTLRDGWRHVRFLLVNSPSIVMVIPGILLVLLGLISLGITISQGDGVSIGSLRWQPVFAGTILLVAGTNALLLGTVGEMMALAQGSNRKMPLVDFYRKHVGFDRLFGGALLLIAVGIGADGYIFLRWTADSSANELLRLAVAGQTALIVGANLAFGSVAIALADQLDR